MLLITTSPQKANLDKNHTSLYGEADFAAKGGLDHLILHGPCTYGFTGKAIVHGVFGTHAGWLKSFSAHFMGQVFPGDTLTAKGWKMDAGQYTVQTATQDGRVVIRDSVAEIG